MSPHRPKGRTIWRVKVPNRHGGWSDRSTGSRDKAVARAMDRMLEELGPKGARAWDLLDRVTDGSLSLGRLYDAYRDRALVQLRAELADVDLRPVLDRWQQWLRGRVHEATAARYLTHLETLATRPWWRSVLTPAAVEAWLSGRSVSGPTKRKYFAALASFVGYCRSVGLLEEDPLAALHPPRASEPRAEYLELPDVRRVVDALPEPDRTLVAFLYGTGCDLSAALGLTRRDVDLGAWEVRARGTKAYNRDRLVTVAEWARPYLAARCKGLLPDAPLFPGLSRWTASDRHRAAVKTLGLYREGITLHAARHHWAVRALKAGTPVELVARQLGHKDGVLVLRVYGRFLPTREDRAAWERTTSRREARNR